MNGLPSDNLPNASDIYEGIEYQNYWDGIARKKLDELERVLIHRLLPRGFCILDLGCGFGRLFDCYADRFTNTVMFDGSESLLHSAQQVTEGRALYVLGDINALPFRQSAFDAVLMVRVFHHLNQPSETLRDIHRILRSGGSMVMNYSNKRNVYRIAKFLLGRYSHNPFTHEPLTVEANFFHHHPTWISRLLSDCGFEKPVYRGAGVMDKLAGHAGSISRFIPRGTLLAPLLGKTALAPWIFCKAEAQKSDHLLPIKSIEEVLACPVCEGKLDQRTIELECKACKRTFPIRDGIIDMRVDQVNSAKETHR